MIRIIITSLLLSLGISPLLPLVPLVPLVPLSAQPFDPRRLVLVSGEAEAVVTPDRASVSIGVETDGLDVTKLKAANDQRVRAIIDGVKKLGIADKDVQTSQLTIEPVYNYKDGRQELLRYRMRNVVTITVRDLSNVDDVVNLGVAGGSNLLHGVFFSSSKETAIRDSLRVEATRNARSRAEAMATAAGARLGKVVKLEDNVGYQPAYLRKSYAIAELAASDAGTPVEAGELTIRATVNATFEME